MGLRKAGNVAIRNEGRGRRMEVESKGVEVKQKIKLVQMQKGLLSNGSLVEWETKLNGPEM